MSKIILDKETELTEREQKIYEKGFNDGRNQAVVSALVGLAGGVFIVLLIKALL